MNILDAFDSLESNKLRKTEIARLMRMGRLASDLMGKSSLYYDKIMNEYNTAYEQFKKKGSQSVVNIYRVPILPEQVTMLESFGFKFTEESKSLLSDGKTRDLISLVLLASGDEMFCDAYPTWVKESTKSKSPAFTTADVITMRQKLAEMQRERKQMPNFTQVVKSIEPVYVTEVKSEPICTSENVCEPNTEPDYEWSDFKIDMSAISRMRCNVGR